APHIQLRLVAGLSPLSGVFASGYLHFHCLHSPSSLRPTSPLSLPSNNPPSPLPTTTHQWHRISNSVWWQDFPRRPSPLYSSLFSPLPTKPSPHSASSSSAPPPLVSDFASELASFIAPLVAHSPSEAHWVLSLASFDFSRASAVLVASVPGVHRRPVSLPDVCRASVGGAGGKIAGKGTRECGKATGRGRRREEAAAAAEAEQRGATLLGCVHTQVVGVKPRFGPRGDPHGTRFKGLMAALCGEGRAGRARGERRVVLRRALGLAADGNAVAVMLVGQRTGGGGGGRGREGGVEVGGGKWEGKAGLPCEGQAKRMKGGGVEDGVGKEVRKRDQRGAQEEGGEQGEGEKEGEEKEGEEGEGEEGEEEEELVQVGYLPRGVARWVAPVMDAGVCAVEGRVAAEDVQAAASGHMDWLVPIRLVLWQGPAFPASQYTPPSARSSGGGTLEKAGREGVERGREELGVSRTREECSGVECGGAESSEHAPWVGDGALQCAVVRLLGALERPRGLWRLQEVSVVQGGSVRSNAMTWGGVGWVVLSRVKWPSTPHSDFLYASSSVGGSVDVKFVAAFAAAAGRRVGTGWTESNSQGDGGEGEERQSCSSSSQESDPGGARGVWNAVNGSGNGYRKGNGNGNGNGNWYGNGSGNGNGNGNWYGNGSGNGNGNGNWYGNGSGNGNGNGNWYGNGSGNGNGNGNCCYAHPPLLSPSSVLSLPAISLPSRCHLFAISLPSRCHLVAISLPSHCHLVAISLPSRCHLVAISLPSRCHLIAISLPSHCHLVAISLPSHCHLIAISLPSRCHLVAISLPSRCHLVAISLPSHCHLIAISLPSRCHLVAISLPSRCHLVAISLPSHCHLIAISLPSRCHLVAISLPSRCHPVAISVPPIPSPPSDPAPPSPPPPSLYFPLPLPLPQPSTFLSPPLLFLPSPPARLFLTPLPFSLPCPLTLSSSLSSLPSPSGTAGTIPAEGSSIAIAGADLSHHGHCPCCNALSSPPLHLPHSLLQWNGWDVQREAASPSLGLVYPTMATALAAREGPQGSLGVLCFSDQRASERLLQAVTLHDCVPPLTAAHRAGVPMHCKVCACRGREEETGDWGRHSQIQPRPASPSHLPYTAARTASALPCPPLPPPPTFQVAIRRFNPGPPHSTATSSSPTPTPTTGWVYSGSHNFSPAAWGRPVRKRHLSCDPAAAEDLGMAAVLGDCLHVLNFELGVVLVDVPSRSGQHTQGQRAGQGQGQRGQGQGFVGLREGKLGRNGLQGGRGRWGGQWGRQQGQLGRWKNGSASGIGGSAAAATDLWREEQQAPGGSGSACERGMGIDRVHLPFRLPAPRYSRSDVPASGRALKEAAIAAALAAVAAADSESGGEGESVLAHAAAVAAAAGCASSGGGSCAIGSPVSVGGSGGVAAAAASADGAAANAASRKVARASLPGSPLSNTLSSASLKSLLGALSPLAAGATAGAAGAGAAAALGVAERMLQVVEEVDEEEGGAVGVDADALARDALRNETHLLLHDYAKGNVMVRAVGQGGFNLNSPAWDKIVRDRAAGSVEIDYRSVDCPSSRTMAVRIENDSNAYNFVLQILGAAKSGGVEKVEISKDGRDWKSMTNNGWGATWVLNPAKDIVDAGRKVSVRVTAVGGGQQVVLQDVIPSKWSGGKIYESSTNF
ncbi:unnamed protein product, partial [Closterium sp. Naga37s-1]